MGTVLFLCSSDSDFMTGQVLCVGGGFISALSTLALALVRPFAVLSDTGVKVFLDEALRLSRHA